jgi:hypothetical protein
MKKSIIAVLLLGIICSVNAQQFKTSMYIEKEAKLVSNNYQTDVIISPTTITIKKWNSGKTEDQVMKIDKIETKPYIDKMCTWYFCTDIKKDDITGTYYKDICVYNKNEKTLIYASFADEVSIYWYKFRLK